jgi:hypothetical protein
MNFRKPLQITAIVAVLALAACHSTTANSTNSGGSAQSKSTGKAAAPAKAIDVCTALPAAKAGQLAGQPYTTADDNSDQGWTSGCAYNNDDATAKGVNVNIDTKTATNTWNLVHTGNIAEISGLGDKAFWDNDNTLYALVGSVLIQVNGLESEQASEALAKVIVAALQ